jgi:Protein of unknown function (DUF3017)
MANRPANAGAHSAGPRRGSALVAQVLAWLPYLIVLAGVTVGVFVTWLGSPHAGWGAAVVGGALLAAATARLLLPPRHAGVLASRGKAMDVAAFAVLGAAVLGVALSLP